MLAHGLIDTVGDIDLLAAGAAWERAARLAEPEAAPHGDWVVHVTPDLDIYSGWLGQDVAAILSRAEVIDGLPVAHLSDVAAYKRLLDRPKDKDHVRLLEVFLGN